MHPLPFGPLALNRRLMRRHETNARPLPPEIERHLPPDRAVGGRDEILQRPRPLVDAQHGYPRAGAPRGHVRHLVDQVLQAGAGGVLVHVLQPQHDAEVVRQLGQRADIALDELGGVVVVGEDRDDAGGHGVDGLAEADVDAEEDVEGGVGEEVEVGAQEAADAEAVGAGVLSPAAAVATATGAGAGGGGGGGGKVFTTGARCCRLGGMLSLLLLDSIEEVGLVVLGLDQ